jgi:hypothetical protein
MRRRSPRFWLPSGAAYELLPLIAEALKRFGPDAKVRDLEKVAR